MTRIEAEALTKVIEQELNAYQKQSIEQVRAVVTQVTDEAVQQLKRTSPKRSGRYARGWKATATKDTNTGLVKKIHNRTPSLTHLLENGHAKQNGGRVEGIKHIAPVEEAVIKKLESKLRQKL